jgi:DNA-binding XRE family transcriptional regulator
LTFTQRTIDVPLVTKTGGFRHGNSLLPQMKGTIGDLIIAYRKEAGLTQRQLAVKAGIARKWLGRWERGRAMPNEAQWSQLATVLHFP